jgi:hypothetical protein
VWCALDEVTRPAPDSPEFYLQVLDRLVAFAEDCGISERSRIAVRRELAKSASEYPNRLDPGAVREFVKDASLRLLSVEG